MWHIRAWRSRRTESFAAYIGMLSVLGTVVVKYVAKGYSVELPFGTLRANATAMSAVRSGLEYRQVAPDTTGAAQTSWAS